MTSSVFIEGRSWLDKFNGNSYWSARIWVDGAVVVQLPMAYGYGEMYVQQSVAWLIENGYLPEHRTVGELRKQGIALYRSITPALKREMFRAWTPDEN